MAQKPNSGRMHPREDNRAPRATKKGPGRYHKGGEPGNRLTKERPMRAYLALLAAWAARRVSTWKGPFDKHGAFTWTGRIRHPEVTSARRPWLAGISAQRGY